MVKRTKYFVFIMAIVFFIAVHTNVSAYKEYDPNDLEPITQNGYLRGYTYILTGEKVDNFTVFMKTKPEAMRIQKGACETAEFFVDGEGITNLKVNNPAIAAARIEFADNLGHVKIAVYGKKCGTTRITFNKENGYTDDRSLETIKVKVVKNANPVKWLKYDGKLLDDGHPLTIASKDITDRKKYASFSGKKPNYRKKGKLSLKMNKGYKLIRIEVGRPSRIERGKATQIKWETTRINKKIKLGKESPLDPGERMNTASYAPTYAYTFIRVIYKCEYENRVYKTDTYTLARKIN